MSSPLRYHRGAERPALKLWLLDDDNTLIDFSSGYSFQFLIGVVGETAVLTKTTGITGAAGAGVAPTGTPNVTVTWAANDLDIVPGSYVWQLKATTSSLDRLFSGVINVLNVLT